MEQFYGFDLGDAESAVARLEKASQMPPEVLTVHGAKSFITAYAALSGGELVIGESACTTADAVRRKLRFKSRFLTDPSVRGDVLQFAAGVLGELKADGKLGDGDSSCFYIGCPAGWSRNTRERYREIFEQAGYPPVRIVSESRAAMVSACQSKHLQVGYDILSKPVLVVDIGSSTTDFAYIMNGHEVEMQTAGEVVLGGGIMDEILLEHAVQSSKDAQAIRQVFAESEPWKNYCEFAARRLKERYFSDEAYWENHECSETVLIYYKDRIRLTMRMDKEIAKALTESGAASLKGQSFRNVFTASLKEVKENIHGQLPELVFLTGGVSKLPEIRNWCEDAFPESVIIAGAEPEFSVARGLAWSGRIDEELREFRMELQELENSDAVETIVGKQINALYHRLTDTMVEPIIRHAAVPVFEKWRDGEVKRLSDTDDQMQREIEAYLHSDEARGLLENVISDWLRPVADALEDYTVPICVRHHVPYRALSLNSYLEATDIEIHINARDLFAVEEITLMIDSMITVLIGVICGGSGVALISTGPHGIIAGALASLLVLLLGKGKMEEALLKVNLPKPLRKLVSRNLFISRLDSVTAQVKGNVYESLEKGKSEEIQSRLTEEISREIENCLTKMAEIVEIPLGS